MLLPFTRPAGDFQTVRLSCLHSCLWGDRRLTGTNATRDRPRQRGLLLTSRGTQIPLTAWNKKTNPTTVEQLSSLSYYGPGFDFRCSIIVKVFHFNQYGAVWPSPAWWQEMVRDWMSPLKFRFRFRFMRQCVYLDSFIHVFAARWLPHTHVVRLLSGTVVCNNFPDSFPKPKLSGLKNYLKEIAKRLSHGPVCLCGSEESVS